MGQNQRFDFVGKNSKEYMSVFPRKRHRRKALLETNIDIFANVKNMLRYLSAEIAQR